MRGRRLVLLFALAGCADKATAPYPTSEPPAPADAALGPGDVFEVRVFGEENRSGTWQVAADGTIDYPLVGKVSVVGKLPGAVAAELKTRLADGYLGGGPGGPVAAPGGVARRRKEWCC